MRIGLHIDPRGLDDVAAISHLFERAESTGFASAWLGHVLEHDALTVLAIAALATRTIELGTFVVPTPPRHPAALAQQALTVQLAARGRLCLGIGAGHEAITARRLGIAADRPVERMREYLTVLRPLLRGDKADHVGSDYRVRIATPVGGAGAPPVLLAALGPKMLGLAAELADGVALWLAGPRFVEQQIAEPLARAARHAGRPEPRIVCGLPVAVVDDAAGARRAVDVFLEPSARLPAYRRVLRMQRARRPSDVSLIGSEHEVLSQLAELSELGVHDLNAVLIPIDGQPGTRRRTAELLMAWSDRMDRSARPGTSGPG